MRLKRQVTIISLFPVLLFPALLFGQEKPAPPAPSTQGSIDFGVRHVWGDVYGRPDLPFSPNVLTSKFNEYSDQKNGFIVRRLNLNADDILGTKNYVKLQSQNTLFRNQSYLATLGRYREFRVQFRYDSIPHIYSNTSRILYAQTGPGVYTIPTATKERLAFQSSNNTSAVIGTTLPGFVVTQVACGTALPPNTQPPPCDQQFFTPSILRKTVSGFVDYEVTPDWRISGFYARENQQGTRPIGLLFAPSPTASASSQPSNVSGLQSPNTGAELPEPISYFTNTARVVTEYGKKSWALQLGYTGSFFHNSIRSLTFDNPFATADIAVQLIPNGTGGCTTTGGLPNCTIGAVPARGQKDLWPSNRAQYLNFAAASDVGKYVHVMGTINPGWLRQNEPFLPYSSNSQIFFPNSTGALTIPATSLSLLPAPSLNGQKQTLAMNYTAVFQPLKDVELKAAYRHYDYNNNTPVYTLTPILGDTIGANPANTAQLTPGDPTVTSGSGSLETTVGRSNPGFNKKTLELSGEWFFTKRSSLKAGYEAEWFDRSHRDVAHSYEGSPFASVDYSPSKDLLFRVAYRHSDRKPDLYEDEASLGLECDPAVLLAARTAGLFPSDHPCGRRFDEAARILDRADALVEYSVENLTLSGSFQTIQQNFNRRGEGSNSREPLNFLTGSAATTAPYYLYGAMNDIAHVYTFDADYAISPAVSLFAEYTHERYYKRMISRNRSPFNTTAPFCPAGGCDSANNDWESLYRDVFDTYAAGIDVYAWKKFYFTPYYSLSQGIGKIDSRFLGNPNLLTAGDPDKFVLVGSSAAVPYPNSITRIHEFAAVFKYKLTKNLVPRLEYRLQQFDNRDAQTSAMTPYMGCISPASGTLVNGCPPRQLIGTTSPNPTFVSSPFYPGFVVGDTSAARYIFLGVDQPSFRVHMVTATLEYRF
jgi:hypothetical protein